MAKECLRARARELRAMGWSVNDLAVELAVAKSTAWRWVRDLPLDPDSERARRKRERGKLLTDARWAEHRRRRDEVAAAIRAEAVRCVGSVDVRDLILTGAVAYWCEGAKAKPWRALGQLAFCNSDDRLIRLYLAFLRVLGVPAGDVRFRVAIHESADVDAAVAWWAAVVGVPADRFLRTVVKRHSPGTGRRNTGDGYRGCLTVSVRRGIDVYRRIEAVVDAIVSEVAPDGADRIENVPVDGLG